MLTTLFKIASPTLNLVLRIPLPAFLPGDPYEDVSIMKAEILLTNVSRV